ncbi:hypothetical protein LUZ60_005038 [Juncus effusus]|nr:hypothetical protein LUZ60_005038 [Juncus effusus]
MASLLSAHPFPFPHKPNPFLQTHKPSFSIHSSSLSINAQNEPTAEITVCPPTDAEIRDYTPEFNYSVWKKDDDIPPPLAPLICFFGAAVREFVPTVRVSEERSDPDEYNMWKMVQWHPPEFARAPGGPSSNVAVAHARLGGRSEFMGKVGTDQFGKEMELSLRLEGVQTRALTSSKGVRTGATYMKLSFVDGEEDRRGRKKKKLVAETVKPSAEDSFVESEIRTDILEEADMLHFNSEALLTPSMNKALFKAIKIAKESNTKIFFDPNLPLILWKSRSETLNLVKPAWFKSEFIEVNRHELEFLLNEPYFIRKRTVPPEYYAENNVLMKDHHRDYYHYTRDDLAPLWHDGIKLLIVSHATRRIHYYTQQFDGFVIGAEDVLLAAMGCDRSGSGDAIVAAIMRKVLKNPELLENQDLMERELRFVISAGIIAQWSSGAVNGFPTEGAAQNMKEQLYIPSMW